MIILETSHSYLPTATPNQATTSVLSVDGFAYSEYFIQMESNHGFFSP